jgi:hypothetical protein
MSELNVDMKPRITLKKGLYTAKVVDVTEKQVTAKDGTTPTYVDIHFALNGRKDGNPFPQEAQGYILKHSVPARVTANSKLADVLIAAGCKLQTGSKVDPKAALMGKDAELVVGIRPWTAKDGRTMEAPEIRVIDFVAKR